jgi:hypothetical protein
MNPCPSEGHPENGLFRHLERPADSGGGRPGQLGCRAEGARHWRGGGSVEQTEQVVLSDEYHNFAARNAGLWVDH